MKNSLLRTVVIVALFAAAAFTLALDSAGATHSVRAGDSSGAVVYTPDWNSTGS